MEHYDPDSLYAAMAVRLGVANAQDVQLCAQMKHQRGLALSLEQLLLQQGAISPQSAMVVRQHLAHGAPMMHPSSGSAYGGTPSGQGVANSMGYNAMASYAPAAQQQTPPMQSYETNQAAFISQVSDTNPSTSHGGAWDTSAGTGYTNAGLSRSSAAELPEIGSQFGRYRIEKVLGKGGMGIVYQAIQTELDRKIALKMLLAGNADDGRLLRRFYSEARSVARLSHPGIVPIHDVGEVDGLHYFTMDFIEGSNLEQDLQETEFDEQESLSLIRKILDALDYAHRQEIIHRDLKPANILMDSRGDPKITDFGIAKDVRADDGETISGEVLGTPAYMSPEQANGNTRNLDARTDLFSVGAMLYELLYKEQAFQGASQYSIVTKVLTHDPTPPAIERNKVSPEAEAVCFKLLEKDREDRYQSAREVIDDLDLVLAGRRPKAPLRRAKIGGGLRQLGVLVAGALLAASLIGGAIWFVNNRAHQRELQKQREDKLIALEKKLEADKKAAADKRERQSKARGRLDDAERLARSGETERAVKLAEEACDLDKETPLIRLRAAEILLSHADDAGRALELVEDLLGSESVGEEAGRIKVRALYAKDDISTARRALRALTNRFPEARKSLFVLRYKARFAMGEKSWRLAIRDFDALLERVPDDQSARAELAFCLAQTKRWDKALKEAETALRRDNGLVSALQAKAMVHLEKRERSAALEAADRALELAKRASTQSELQALLVEIRKLRQAPKVITPPRPGPTAGADKDKCAQGHVLIKQARAFIKERKRDETQRCTIAARAALANTTCPTALNEVGVLFNSLGDYKSAEGMFSRAVAMKSDYSQGYANRAFVRNRMGHYEDALKDSETAIKLGRTDDYTKRCQATAYRGLAMAKAKVDDYDGSLAFIGKSLQILPSWVGLRHRAYCYMKLKRFEEGEADLRKLFESLGTAEPTAGTRRLEADYRMLQGQLWFLSGKKKDGLDELQRARKVASGAMVTVIEKLIEELIDGTKDP